MYSEDTLEKIRRMERFIYGGVVERCNGRLVYSADGSPVPIPERSILDVNKPQIARQVEALFRIILPDGITFPPETGYYHIDTNLDE